MPNTQDLISRKDVIEYLEKQRKIIESVKSDSALFREIMSHVESFMKDIKQDIEQLPPALQWTKTSEGLPEKTCLVFTVCNNDFNTITSENIFYREGKSIFWRWGQHYCNDQESYITHWMPMPTEIHSPPPTL